MTWNWRYEADDGTPVVFGESSASDDFPTQGDAETWIGEVWRELFAGGIAQVSLLEAGRKAYGPMSLRPMD
jgi:hypothetical protein